MKSKVYKALLGLLVMVAIMSLNVGSVSAETGNIPASHGSTSGRGCQFLRDQAREVPSVSSSSDAPDAGRAQRARGAAANL